MVNNKTMAFAIYTEWDYENHYIHKQFGKSDSSPNTTRNMNFAMLFAVESDARRFIRKFQLTEFQPKFIPITIKEVVLPEVKKSNYNNYTKLKRYPLENYLPDFLKEN